MKTVFEQVNNCKELMSKNVYSFVETCPDEVEYVYLPVGEKLGKVGEMESQVVKQSIRNAQENAYYNSTFEGYKIYICMNSKPEFLKKRLERRKEINQEILSKRNSSNMQSISLHGSKRNDIFQKTADENTLYSEQIEKAETIPTDRELDEYCSHFTLMFEENSVWSTRRGTIPIQMTEEMITNDGQYTSLVDKLVSLITRAHHTKVSRDMEKIRNQYGVQQKVQSTDKSHTFESDDELEEARRIDANNQRRSADHYDPDLENGEYTGLEKTD